MRLKRAQGRDYTYYIYIIIRIYIYNLQGPETGHVSLPAHAHSFIACGRTWVPHAPAIIRSFTSIQMVHTHTHWYPSHLQMKDQGRKLSCKNDRLKQFLCLACSSAWYLLGWKTGYCISWRRLRWDQVRSNTWKYTLYILTCIPKSPSMSGTRRSVADLIYLNSLTATAWFTVSNVQVRQKGVPFWYHRSKRLC